MDDWNLSYPSLICSSWPDGEYCYGQDERSGSVNVLELSLCNSVRPGPRAHTILTIRTGRLSRIRLIQQTE